MSAACGNFCLASKFVDEIKIKDRRITELETAIKKRYQGYSSDDLITEDRILLDQIPDWEGND